MTAEIAILNKLAVALAADSAVSIGRPPNLKIYNTVNKIFELSNHEPVGIMVYGRLDFMHIPYEPLIKEFRRKLGRKKFDTIEEYRTAFQAHLSKDIKYSDRDEQRNLVIVLSDALQDLNKKIDDAVWRDIQDKGKYLRSKVNGVAQKLIRTEIAALKSTPFAAGFTRKAIPQTAAAMVDLMIDRSFNAISPNAATKKLLQEYAGYLLSKSALSSSRTGIVIAGFGEAEIFPTLSWFETDGIIDGKLKVVDEPTVDIDRSSTDAEILGFAQDDMMKSFMDGIDPDVKSYIFELIEKSIGDTANQVLSAVVNDPQILPQASVAVAPVISQIAAALRNAIDDHVKKAYSDPIKDMIRAMPKQELATLAMSLIEITSLKRKVSRDQETVGGEVDVAIISKSEGFVWIKRKHYFPAELNRRFSIRQGHLEQKEA